jgi:hypothetical protein
MEHSILEACYERHRADGGTTTGEFIVAWVVAEDGSVEHRSFAAERDRAVDAGTQPFPAEVGECAEAGLRYPRGLLPEARWMKVMLYGAWPVRDE